MENYFQMNFTTAQINAFSNLGLAHIGDGVYELSLRDTTTSASLCSAPSPQGEGLKRSKQ